MNEVPQYLCFLRLPQNSLAALKFCPLCHRSCRNSAGRILWDHSFWRKQRTWPYMEHILILCTVVWLTPRFLKLDGSLQAKIWDKQNQNRSMKMRWFKTQILKKIIKKIEQKQRRCLLCLQRPTFTICCDFAEERLRIFFFSCFSFP